MLKHNHYFVSIKVLVPGLWTWRRTNMYACMHTNMHDSTLQGLRSFAEGTTSTTKRKRRQEQNRTASEHIATFFTYKKKGGGDRVAL